MTFYKLLGYSIFPSQVMPSSLSVRLPNRLGFQNLVILPISYHIWHKQCKPVYPTPTSIVESIPHQLNIHTTRRQLEWFVLSPVVCRLCCSLSAWTLASLSISSRVLLGGQLWITFWHEDVFIVGRIITNVYQNVIPYMAIR